MEKYHNPRATEGEFIYTSLVAEGKSFTPRPKHQKYFVVNFSVNEDEGKEIGGISVRNFTSVVIILYYTNLSN